MGLVSLSRDSSMWWRPELFRIARHAASTQDWLHFMNVYYTDTAKQQLKELQRPFQKRILDKVAVYASLPNPLEFAEPLAGYDMNRFRVGDYRVAFQIDQNIISLADIRQTTNSVNPLCAVSDSSVAASLNGKTVRAAAIALSRSLAHFGQ